MMTPAIIEAMRAELSTALPRWGMSARATLAFLSHSENTTFLAEDPLAGQRIVAPRAADRVSLAGGDCVGIVLDRGADRR
jgi:hypothetical protein